MKYNKKTSYLLLFTLFGASIGAMESPLGAIKEEVKAAQQKPVNFEVEEFRPNRDKKEVFQLIKDAWPTNLGGSYDEEKTVGSPGNSRKISSEQWLADHVINPVAMGPDFKYVDVARNAQAPEGSKILGIATYYMFFKKPENPNERQRGYVETLISKSSLSEANRKAVEKALLARVIDQIKSYNPELYEKQVRQSNNVSIDVFKEAGFDEKGSGKDKAGNTWIIFELTNVPAKK